MSNPRVNFIGCGRVGKTIGKLFSSHNTAKVEGVVCSSLESAISSVAFIGQGKAYKTADNLPKADIFFITTRDDIIELTCENLVNKGISNSIIVHCSGSLSSDILLKAKNSGCLVASIHPIKSFASPEASVKNFSGTYCAVEGDAAAVSIISDLFNRIGANVFQINKNNKHLYHAAGVIANNYLVTLHYHAVQCYKASGIEDQTAKKIVSMLMSDALNNLKTSNHQKALTGPIQRGDTNTITSHNSALKKEPVLQHMYTALGLATLPLTNHSEEKKNELVSVLKKAKL